MATSPMLRRVHSRAGAPVCTEKSLVTCVKPVQEICKQDRRFRAEHHPLPGRPCARCARNVRACAQPRDAALSAPARLPASPSSRLLCSAICELLCTVEVLDSLVAGTLGPLTGCDQGRCLQVRGHTRTGDASRPAPFTLMRASHAPPSLITPFTLMRANHAPPSLIICCMTRRSVC